jgi:hypothetical protein
MGNNPSVRRFRTDMLNLSKDVGKSFHEEALAQADELIGNMRSAIDHNVSGHLAQSLRKQDVTNQNKISVLVRAGGHLTMRREASGVHDYSLDEEFGNVREAPRPFFYSTFRFYQRAGVERFRETLDQAIEENNRQRATRAESFYQLGSGVTIGTRFRTTSSAGRSRA